MKTLKSIVLLGLTALLLTSCGSSVRVSSDYDQEVNFKDYKTFAFYKPGIDKAEISDIDKRRILRAIEAEMLAKGFTKSDNPELLVSIFAKAKTRVDVYDNNFGWGGFGWGGFGWGAWGPWGGWGLNRTSVVERTDGILYVDLIDATKRQLVWQGKGTARLFENNVEKRDARIKEIVSEIMMVYPPNLAGN